MLPCCPIEASINVSAKSCDDYFSDLTNPLYIKDLTRQEDFQLLYDVVRKSEDVGFDNHIYLYYENETLFYSLCCLIDFSNLLSEKKFVFLIGNDAKTNYKICEDNYIDCYFKPIRLCELKKLTAYIMSIRSGGDMIAQVLSVNKDVSVIVLYEFNNYLYHYSDNFEHYLNFLEDKRIKVGFDKFNMFCDSALSAHFHGNIINKKAFLKEVKSIVGEEEHNAPNWLRIFALADYNLKNGSDYVSRIIPTIYFDVHTEWYMKTRIFPTYCDFTHRNFHFMVRNPIVRLYSWIRASVFRGCDAGEINLYYHYKQSFVEFCEYEKIGEVVGFKFEDFKNKPEENCKQICDYLKVPYDVRMLNPEVKQENLILLTYCGKKVVGFDKSTLDYDTSDLFSDLDMLRLELVYEKLMKKYNYQIKLNYKPKTRKEAEILFNLPYRFESLFFSETIQTAKDARQKIAQTFLDIFYYCNCGQLPTLYKG